MPDNKNISNETAATQVEAAGQTKLAKQAKLAKPTNQTEQVNRADFAELAKQAKLSEQVEQTTLAEQMEQAELAKIRSGIDLLDTELLRLLNMRAELSLRVGAIKKTDKAPVRRPEREQQVLQALHAQNTGPLNAGQIDAIYERIFEISRELQQ